MPARFRLVFPVFLIASTVALSQTDEQITSRFKQLDKNSDGKLSAEELKDHPDIAALIKGAETDKDGQYSLPAVLKHFAKAAPGVDKSADSIKEAPKLLAPGSVGVGRLVPDFKLKGLDGKEARLAELAGKNGLVLAFTNTTCPIAKKYGPSLAKLEESLASQGVSIVFVNPTPKAKAEEMLVFTRTHKLKGLYFHDADGSLAKSVNATTTTEVFLLDTKRTIHYRGAIDDQYGLGYSLDQPRQTFLINAVEARLAGRVPNPAATTAPGCDLDLAAAKSIVSSVTYHNRISRIMQTHCVECHHAGGVGPFNLDTADDVIAHAGIIRRVLEKGTMPPWFAKPGAGEKTGVWANDRTVPEADKTDLMAWLKGDKAMGDTADAPLPRSFADGWLIGKPDMVLKFEKPVPVKADGIMPYQKVVIETKLTEDKWVRALEVRPSARQVVHHALIFILPPKKENFPDPDSDESSGYFAEYAPGQSVLNYPDGYAKKLPKGSRLYFQMHYTPNGTATADETSLGLVFAKETPKHEVRVIGIANPNILIKAGAAHHPEKAKLTVPGDVTILGFLPHMHVRGSAFRYEITKPGEAKATVLDIPRYDFNWQLYYRLAEPMAVKKGTVIDATGWFDNSKNNPANPDPSIDVVWGPQTFDEMMLGYVEYIVTPEEPQTIGGLKQFDPVALFKRIDLNGDGKIDEKEYAFFTRLAPQLRGNPDGAKKLWERLDADKDGSISFEEFKKIRK